jgi:hypothetical protein
MGNDPAVFCATDKEIFDLLLSGKRRMSEAKMRQLAQQRGIFYSDKDSREKLADNLSMLPHGFHEVTVLIEHGEVITRSEKTTSVVLPAVEMSEIKDICGLLVASADVGDKVTAFQRGAEAYEVHVGYSEIDYSKTRLIQRRQREANIEFELQAGKTVVRFPATPKANEIVEDLRKRLEISRKKEVPVVRIELTPLQTADARTEFFTKLITSIPEFTVTNVTSIRVESGAVSDAEEEDAEDANAEEAKEEMLSAVQNAVLKGQSLLSTEVYQRFRESGFFITSIVWDAKQSNSLSLFQFEAAFEDAIDGKGFKYNIRGVRRNEGGSLLKTFRPVLGQEKTYLFELIENTAANVLEQLVAKQQAINSAVTDQGGAS